MRISKNRIDLEGARLDNAVINNSTLSGTTAATQADQETGTSTTVAVTPGRQHFNPGHPKCWAYVTVSGGVPTLQTSYNITSITDTAVGVVTVTIETDFSTANWAPLVSCDIINSTGNPGGVSYTTVAAGSIRIEAYADGGETRVDLIKCSFAGFGDQA